MIKDTGNTPENDASENDDDMPFDPTTAIDAGNGEDMQIAEEKTKAAVFHIAENKASKENHLNEVREIPNIVERAKKILYGHLIQFPDTKALQQGVVVLNCDKNRFAAFDALFGNGDNRPHIDTFRGRFVDWNGIIVDDFYPVVELLDALHVMGLRQQSTDSIRKSFREWGLQVKTNDLIKRFDASVPEWDNESRLETYLTTLFGCYETDLNKSFSRYFWLSLYCRITKPGCMAPMVLSLFGGQDVGKSYLSTLICRILTGDAEAAPVQLDMGANKIDFLRSITGRAVVANIGEMTGFSRTDLNAIKQFITATSDDMHQKFEGHFQQMRQWIAIMDGNKYEGLQRDETGNRRFYPMFVGQIDDVDGQPAWKSDFVADFSTFDVDLWQIMAECRIWMELNGGIDGYNDLVRVVSKQVKDFSQSEMERGRGVVADYTLDAYLVPALLDLHKLNASVVDGRKNKGIFITTANLTTRLKAISRGGSIKDNHLKTRMIALGALYATIENCRGYIFPDIMTDKDYLSFIKGNENETKSEILKTFSDDEGF